MSSSTSPPSTGASSPNSSVSPKTAPNADGYFNQPRAETPRLESITEHVKADHAQRPRASSAASISFSQVGGSQGSVGGRVRSRPRSLIRDASPPPPKKFKPHISFDNFAAETTQKNVVSFTLKSKHAGYTPRRRSRTFLVGLDENNYSDIALQWLLDELVDDGDDVVCLRVVERDSKIASDKKVEKKEYRKEAHDLMCRIQGMNNAYKGICITLEFAVGKVSNTFASMIAMHEPSMLIVGTKGRSLNGIPGLVSNRNSFSKWCLQHSPSPVVVVRPTEKRIHKKIKRSLNPQRQDYARILRESGLEKHEMVGGGRRSSFEVSNEPGQEAEAVATALGLPAEFDLTKSFVKADSDPADPTKSDTREAANRLSSDSRSISPIDGLKSPKLALLQLESPAISGDEAEESEDEDEEEGDFEVVPGHTLLGNQPEDEKKEKLHEMEQEEAHALLSSRKDSISSAASSGSGGVDAPIDELELPETAEPTETAEVNEEVVEVNDEAERLEENKPLEEIRQTEEINDEGNGKGADDDGSRTVTPASLPGAL